MVEMSIYTRRNDAAPYIQYRVHLEQFPLHPNYSTSVKTSGSYYHSTSYFNSAPAARFGPLGAHLGPSETIC